MKKPSTKWEDKKFLHSRCLVLYAWSTNANTFNDSITNTRIDSSSPLLYFRSGTSSRHSFGTERPIVCCLWIQLLIYTAGVWYARKGPNQNTFPPPSSLFESPAVSTKFKPTGCKSMHPSQERGKGRSVLFDSVRIHQNQIWGLVPAFPISLRLLPPSLTIIGPYWIFPTPLDTYLYCYLIFAYPTILSEKSLSLLVLRLFGFLSINVCRRAPLPRCPMFLLSYAVAFPRLDL